MRFAADLSGRVSTLQFVQNVLSFLQLMIDHFNPSRIFLTGCEVAFEPNCTTGPTVPRAAALFGIYRKRATAAFWQSHGLKVIVDLNICDDALDLTLLGVPQGWRSYATRSHRGDSPGDHLRRHRMAVERAGTEDVLFILVGGGKAARGLCDAHGWVHVPEHCRVVRGGLVAYGG